MGACYYNSDYSVSLLYEVNRMQVVFNVNLDEQYVYKESYIKELAQFDEQTLATALAYARNMKLYGIDVTDKWDTVVEQSEALKNAYNKGYADALDDYKRVRYDRGR